MFEDEFLREEADTVTPPHSAIFTVKGWLQLALGTQLGQDLYVRLNEAAQAAAAFNGLDGKPGIVFDDQGGEFVSLADVVD